MTRAEMLAVLLPVEQCCVSIAPDGTRTPIVYRYETREQRDQFDAERRRAYHGLKP